MVAQTAIRLLVGFVMFAAVARWIFLWYFRIDRAVAALEDIAASLRCMPAVQDQQKRSAGRSLKAA
jgi:hypothetical protein